MSLSESRTRRELVNPRLEAGRPAWLLVLLILSGGWMWATGFDLTDNGFVGTRDKYKPNLYGIVGYIDLVNDSIYGVTFDERNHPARYLHQQDSIGRDLTRPLNSPRENEEMVFLRHNQRVGEGTVASFGGGLSEGQSEARIKLVSGSRSDVVMSKSLFEAQRRRLSQPESDTVLPPGCNAAVAGLFQERAMDEVSLQDFRIREVMPARLDSATPMWLVKGAATLRTSYQELAPLSGHDYQLSEILPAEDEHQVIQTLGYHVIAIVSRYRGQAAVEYLEATPDKSDSTTEHWINAFDLAYVIEADTTMVDHIGWGFDTHPGFVDWLDADGDGTSEVLLKFDSYEGYGDVLLKKIEGEWKVVAGYYIGV